MKQTADEQTDIYTVWAVKWGKREQSFFSFFATVGMATFLGGGVIIQGIYASADKGLGYMLVCVRDEGVTDLSES